MTQIAVLGYGTVGSGVVEVLKTNHESICRKAGQEINIKYVLDLRDFPEDPIQKKIVRYFLYAFRILSSHCRSQRKKHK